MTTLTPNFDLPYPDGLDEPCDFPQQWCDFTNAIQGVLDGFQAAADRTNPATLVAKMDIFQAQTLVGNTFLSFDSVLTNNAAMIDFDQSRSIITVKRPGRYATNANITFLQTAVANSIFALSITTEATSINLTQNIDVANTAVVGSLWCGSVRVTSPPDILQIRVTPPSPTTPFVVVRGTFSVFWTSD